MLLSQIRAIKGLQLESLYRSVTGVSCLLPEAEFFIDKHVFVKSDVEIPSEVSDKLHDVADQVNAK